ADTDAEVEAVKKICADLGVKALEADHWAAGGEGTLDLAQTVVDTIENEKADFNFLYPDDMPLVEKVRTIAQKIYRADDISVPSAVMTRFKELEDLGYGNYPVCIAKTQYSFSTNPALKGAPTGHEIPVREVRLSGGAEFVVVVCGDIMTMPGLPRVPAAEAIGVDKNGEIVGLF
ncbi:MAG: formate--tetrahydrofolate ligase, partial [Rhodospirillales bacterium]